MMSNESDGAEFMATSAKWVADCENCHRATGKQSLTKHMRSMETPAGIIDVGRCMVCDVRPCEKCQSRTLDPTAAKCQHCGADIRVRGKL